MASYALKKNLYVDFNKLMISVHMLHLKLGNLILLLKKTMQINHTLKIHK